MMGKLICWSQGILILFHLMGATIKWRILCQYLPHGHHYHQVPELNIDYEVLLFDQGTSYSHQCDKYIKFFSQCEK